MITRQIQDKFSTNTGQISRLKESRSSSFPAQGGRRLGAVQLAQVVVHLVGCHSHHHRRHQANVGGDEDDDQERNDVPTSTLVAYSSSFSLGFLTCTHHNLFMQTHLYI